MSGGDKRGEIKKENSQNRELSIFNFISPFFSPRSARRLGRMSENDTFVAVQSRQQGVPQHAYRQNLADSHGSDHIDDQIRRAVGIAQHPGDDQGVGNDGGQAHQPFVAAQMPGPHGPDEGGQASEHHVQHGRTAEQVGQQAADEQPWHRGRREEGQDAQRLRNPKLHGAKADGREYHGQRHIDGRDGGSVDNQVHIFVALSHIQFSPLVLF